MRQTCWSIPSWWQIAFFGLRRLWAAKILSPALTAVLAAGFTHRSPGQNFRRFPRGRGSPPKNCGTDPQLLLLFRKDRVEKRNGQVRNVEIAKFKNVKDPAKSAFEIILTSPAFLHGHGSCAP